MLPSCKRVILIESESGVGVECIYLFYILEVGGRDLFWVVVNLITTCFFTMVSLTEWGFDRGDLNQENR